jgi:hypothetical protein
MRGAPIVRLNHLGGLAGLGQATGQFTEEALFALQAELQQVRAEREHVEAEIEAVRTGRPPPSRRAAPPGHAAAPPGHAEPPPRQLPGGSIKIPGVGNVPVLVLAGGAALLALMRRK